MAMNLQRTRVALWDRKCQVIWKSITIVLVVSSKEKVNLDQQIVVDKDPQEDIFQYTRKEGKQNRFVGQYNNNNNQRLAPCTSKQDEEDMIWRDREKTSEVHVIKEWNIPFPTNVSQSNPAEEATDTKQLIKKGLLLV